MEDIIYHESFVRNSMVIAFKEDNNKMEHCQGHQKTRSEERRVGKEC